MKTKTTTLVNDFHGRRCRVRIVTEGPHATDLNLLSVGQMARARKTLCGRIKCPCGGLAEPRTAEGHWVNRMEYILGSEIFFTYSIEFEEE